MDLSCNVNVIARTEGHVTVAFSMGGRILSVIAINRKEG